MKHADVTHYAISSPKLTAPITLALVTDLHETCYGPRQENLLSAVRRRNPDLILLGGDLFDPSVRKKGAACLIRQLAASFPCFFVSGNHEEWTRRMSALNLALSHLGVCVLRGEVKIIRVKGQPLQVGGVDDPHAFVRSHHSLRLSPKWINQLARCKSRLSPEYFSILLSHRPELGEYYAKSGFDLIACGHAHGGQIRLPFCPGGLLAPHQGFFPKYAGGMYRLGAASMIVSRGLCQNRLPRIGNPPELVFICLRPDGTSYEAY